MGFNWSHLSIPRFYGLDLKTNVIDVQDGESLGAENAYQNGIGVVAKRKGGSILFAADEAGALKVGEIGTATLSGTKYWFKFVDGKFRYATASNGALTTITPSPAVSTGNDIWYACIAGKLFFVDGSADLRYFDGTAIKTSAILSRPTTAPTSSGGSGFDYTYTVDNGLGESPALATAINDEGSLATITVDDSPYAGYTHVVGDKIRVYSKATSTLAQWRNVTPTSGAHANGAYGQDASGGYLEITSTAASYAIITIALTIAQPILYSDLGVALNASAPTALKGIRVHYGRLMGWSESEVAVSKVSNAHSWPTDTAVKEAFRYSFFRGDGESIQGCISFQESFYVMKDTKIAAFGGIGPDDTGNNAFSFRRIETNGVGCAAGKSIQVVGDDAQTNYLVWLGRDGFYASTGDKPSRIGEKVENQVQSVSLSNLRKAVSIYHKREGFYYCFVGSDTVKNGWVLDLRKDGDVRVGWFKLVDINPTCIAWDEDRYIFGTATGVCHQERIAGTSSDFSDVKSEYVETSGVNATTNRFTVANSYATGDEITIRSSGAVPAGLTANTNYFAIRISATVIQFASSQVNALAGTAIDISDVGSGTHSIVGKKAISAFYTTNWIKFKNASLVKKLAKPMILLNAAATSINLTMQIAVDWFESFFDPHVIVVTSSDEWGDLPWGDFVWGAGAVSSPKNVAIARRKCRSIRFKFSNNVLEQDFNLKGIELNYAYIRNRGEQSEAS